MIKEEECVMGNVSVCVYFKFFEVMGMKWNFIFVIMFFGCEYGIKVFFDYWLIWWVMN